jgi:hypothetical protein
MMAASVGRSGTHRRYDGEIAGRDSAHAFTAGLRMTW